MNFKQIKAIEKRNKERILKVCPSINENCGIYILTREDSGLKYAYIGQAKHLLTRLAQHCSGYQHIDLSIKTHGFYSLENKTGWKIDFIECFDLDNEEQRLILYYANLGYQLRNKTAGGQSIGKVVIDEIRAKKGYQNGLQQGYLNAQKKIAKLFDKNLVYEINGKTNKNKEKAFEKFKIFISLEEEENGK